MGNTIQMVMRCTKASGEQHQVELQAVQSSDPSHLNRQLWPAAPAAFISLSMLGADAAARFEEGKEYSVDITPA